MESLQPEEKVEEQLSFSWPVMEILVLLLQERSIPRNLVLLTLSNR